MNRNVTITDKDGKTYTASINVPDGVSEDELFDWADKNTDEIIIQSARQGQTGGLSGKLAPKGYQLPILTRLQAKMTPDYRSRLLTLNKGSQYPVEVGEVSGNEIIPGSGPIEQPDNMMSRLLPSMVQGAVTGGIPGAFMNALPSAMSTREGALDVAESVPDMARMAGQGLGALGGAALGTLAAPGVGTELGAVAGAGVGSGLSEGLIQGIGKIIGASTAPKSSIAGKIGKEAILGAATQGLGSAAGGGLNLVGKLVGSGNSAALNFMQKFFYGAHPNEAAENIKRGFVNLNKKNFDPKTGDDLANKLFNYIETKKNVAQMKADKLTAEMTHNKIAQKDVFDALTDIEGIFQYKNISGITQTDKFGTGEIENVIRPQLQDLAEVAYGAKRGPGGKFIKIDKGVFVDRLQSVLTVLNNEVSKLYNLGYGDVAKALQKAVARLTQHFPIEIRKARQVVAKYKTLTDKFENLAADEVEAFGKHGAAVNKFIRRFLRQDPMDIKLMEEVLPPKLIDEIRGYSAAQPFVPMTPNYGRGAGVGTAVGLATGSRFAGLVSGLTMSIPRAGGAIAKKFFKAANMGSKKAVPYKQAVEAILEKFGPSAFVASGMSQVGRNIEGQENPREAALLKE